jgi:hypothetical protein
MQDSKNYDRMAFLLLYSILIAQQLPNQRSQRVKTVNVSYPGGTPDLRPLISGGLYKRVDTNVDPPPQEEPEMQVFN